MSTFFFVMGWISFGLWCIALLSGMILLFVDDAKAARSGEAFKGLTRSMLLFFLASYAVEYYEVFLK